MSETADLSELRLLVAGRADANLECIASALRFAGVRQVRYCHSVGAAIATLHGGMPDILIVGLDIAPVDGVTFTQVLRDLMPDVPIVLFADFPTRLEVMAAIYVGADDFVRMPLTPWRFLARLQGFIGRPEITARLLENSGAEEFGESTGLAPATEVSQPLLSQAEVSMLLGAPDDGRRR